MANRANRDLPIKQLCSLCDWEIIQSSGNSSGFLLWVAGCRLHISLNAISDVHSGNNRVAQGNAVSIVTGEKEARSIFFDIRHQLAIAAETHIVLGNGAWIK